MAKKDTKEKQPTVDQELEGFNINVNEFGEVSSTIEVEKINDFLNEHLEDKKLKELENNSNETE